jgi:3-methyladenine DNA glycosylase AlkD
MMPGVTQLSASVLDRLDDRLTAAADPARAAAMAAYMRNQFTFAGVPAPALRALSREVLAGLGTPDEADLRAVVTGAWQRPQREYQYFACAYLRKHVAVPGPAFLADACALITTKPWWDTVDALATHFVGGLVRRHPVLLGEMDAWSRDDDIWLIRTAILFQLHYGEQTDTERLFGYCARQAGHPDFFIRKGIGWALRQYARTDPAGVRAFLAHHRSRLSPLSLREAAKHL